MRLNSAFSELIGRAVCISVTVGVEPRRQHGCPNRRSTLSIRLRGVSVIRAGFGRTGTHTLTLALEMLGFGPCHRMEDVNSNPEHRDLMRAAERGESVDWGVVYAG